jgi:ribosomal-protein-alanine N-acetyltransferase
MTLPAITPMTVADLDDIMALERVCFKDPWTRRMYLADLTENELATYLVIRTQNAERRAQNGDADDRSAFRLLPSAIVAYGGFWLLTDEAHIATIAAHPDRRGCGLGLHLLLAMLDAALARGARSSTLEVRAGNLAAIRLYEKLGYRIAGRRRRYYRDGEDGLIMTTPPLADPEMQARLAMARVDALAKLRLCFDRPAQLN